MKKFLLLTGAVVAFLIGYGASASFAAYPSGGIHGRGEHNGYFTNTNDDMGSPVLTKAYNNDTQAVNPNVVDATTFIHFIKYTKLDIDDNGSGNTRDKTGAAFIIHTMLGSSTSARSRPPTDAQISEWEQRVRYLDYNNKVNWKVNYTYTINSYWQATDGGGSNPNDDAFYDENGTSPAIVFRNMNNTVVYAIRIECANPVGTGNLGPLPNNPDYNMWGGSTININDGPTVYSGNVAPGDKVEFHHYLENIGTYATTPNTIDWRVYRDATILYSGDAGTFAIGQRKNDLRSDIITVPANATPGSQICRQVWFTPDTEAGGSQYATERCVTVTYNYDLNPLVNISVNGAAPVGSSAEAGDAISFTYLVQNTGTTASNSVGCTVYRNDRAGSYSAPTPINSSSNPAGYVQPATGCPRTFPANATTNLVTENISAAANTTYCRSFFVSPATYGGASAGVESCIRVVAKPYMKVFGGDVMVGSGLETAPSTCSNNADAQIIGWNKRNPSNPLELYAGAGAQYAVTALNKISDFASAQRAGASAAAPASLSFASTTANVAAGTFGGTFGSAPCIKDYWAQKPASAPAGSSNLSGLGTGVYQMGSSNALGGNINPGQRTVLYIDGNVRITSNIQYPGSWSSGNVPSFLLVVRGNIYIDPAVTQLNGNYVAQGNGVSGGIIYTCSSAISQPSLGGSMYSNCNNKLTVNGSFTANKVELLRTTGSLKQSTPGEANASPTIAEEFIYSPLNWMGQPPIVGNTNDYDAITSLPPIL